MKIEKVIKQRNCLANKLNKVNGKLTSRILKVFDLYRTYKLQSIRDNYPDDYKAIYKWENIEYVGFSISRGGFSIKCETCALHAFDTIYHTIRVDDINVLEMDHDELNDYIMSMINLELVNLLTHGTTKI